MNAQKVKRTYEEMNLINGCIYESNASICQAISILTLFIESFKFDMARPTDIDMAYMKDRWDDAANILWTIKNQLDTASDILGEVLYEDVNTP